MESQIERQRHDSREVINPPVRMGKGTQVDHATNDNDNEEVHPLESLENLRQLLEEIRVLLLLGSCTPLHVDVE